MNLSSFKKQKMYCPAHKKKVQCYFIPLKACNDMQINPMRLNGTQDTNVNNIFDSLITEPDGQEEPISVQWNPSTQEFELVFGYNRYRATGKAYDGGYVPANHPNSNPKNIVPGIWASVFTGNQVDKLRLQLKENGNKKPSSPATKDEIVRKLKEIIQAGGLGVDYFEIPDDFKKSRCKKEVKDSCPQWGGRRFTGVWNLLIKNYGKLDDSLSFKTWGKNNQADYFNNNNDLGVSGIEYSSKYSGTIITVGGKKIALYFVTKKSEIAGALLGSASKKRYLGSKCDEVIIIGCLNAASVKTIDAARESFEAAAREWNSVKNTFTSIYWMPQTKKEMDVHIASGGWARATQL